MRLIGLIGLIRLIGLIGFGTNKIGGTGTQIGMMRMGRMKKQRSATEGKANLLPPVGLGIINN